MIYTKRMNMIANNKAYGLGLLVIAVLNCGFSWNSGTQDHCGQARKIVESLGSDSSAPQRAQAEKNILDLCPDGGATYYLQGLSLEAARNVTGAIEAYRTASRKDPLLAEAKGQLGLLLLQQGARQEASVALFEALQLKANPRYSRALGEIFLEGKLYALALHHYQQTLPTSAADASMHVNMARCYLGLGDQAKAHESLLEALRLEPGNEMAHLELAGIYREEKLYDKAVAELRSAVAGNPDNRDIHLNLAQVLELMGKPAEADKEYALAGVKRTVNATDHLRRAAMYQAAEEFAKEAAEYTTLLLIQPDTPGIREKLGDARLKAGHDSEAIAAYDEAIRRREGTSRILYNLGTLYERKGDLDEAIRRFSEAIRLDSGNSDARRRLAEIYTLRGDFTAAIGEYQELIARHGDNPLNYYKLARLLEKKRDYQAAISAYTKAIKLDQDNIEAHRGIALLHLKRKTPDEAEKHFRAVLRLNPNDSEARNSLISFYVKKKRYDETTELLKDDAGLNPQNPDSQYRLGVMYAFNGKSDDALSQFQKAIKLKPDHARALNGIGKVYLKTGYNDKAKDAFTAARKADPDLMEPVELLSTLNVVPKKQLKTGLKKKSSKKLLKRRGTTTKKQSKTAIKKKSAKKQVKTGKTKSVHKKIKKL